MASPRPATASTFFRLGSLAVTALALLLGWRMPERRGLDYLLSLRGPLGAKDSPVTLVAIDASSLSKLGRWPWDRRIHARLVDRLVAAGARVVAFDVFFGQAASDPDEDRRFAASCRRAGNVVLGSYLAEGPKARGELVVLDPIPALHEAAAGTGLLYHPFDEDGAIRRFQPLIDVKGRLHPSLDLTVVLRHLAIPFDEIRWDVTRTVRIPRAGFGDIVLPLDEESAAPIDFRGPARTFRRISYVDALEGPLPPQIREGIVLVGHVDKTLQDRYLTSVSSHHEGGSMRMAGVEIHANTVDAMLDGRFLRRLRAPQEFLLLAATTFFGAWALYAIRPQRSWIALLALAVAMPTTAYLALAELRVVLPVFRPLWTLLFLYLGTLLFRYVGLEWMKNLEIRRQAARLEAIYATSAVVAAAHRGEGGLASAGAFLDALSTLERHALWLLDERGNPEMRASSRMPREELEALRPRVTELLAGWTKDGETRDPAPILVVAGRDRTWVAPLRSRGRVGGALVAVEPCGEADPAFGSFLASLATLIGQTLDLTSTLEDLRESKRYAELLLGAVSTGVALFDSAGVLLATNESFRRMLAPSPLEVGLLAPILFQGKRELLELLHDTLVEGARPPRELRIHGEEERIFLARSEVFLDEAGDRDGLLLFLDELTELRRLTEKLHRADKLASLGLFAAGIVHEIKNPLTVIRTSAELLQKEVAESKRGPKLVGYIIKDADRLNALAMDILRFSKPEESPAEACDLKEILQGILSIVRPDLSKNRINAFLHLEEDLPAIRADRAGLQQIFMNLFNNARDALADGGGNLEISCRRSAGGGEVEVTIVDDGPGFPPDSLPKIFEPYFTSKGDKGTGLGLSIVLQIVERHGGRIEAENRPEGGALLRLVWPSHRNDAVHLSGAEDAQVQVNSNDEREA